MEKKYKSIALKVLNDIKSASLNYDLINKGDHIVLGLSGGPDSVCLFFALFLLKDELGITLSAVHVNHKFRPGEAEYDQDYVEGLCRSLSVPCRTVVKDCASIAESLGITSEEAGRRVRYAAYDEEADAVAKETGKSRDRIKIAVAHNAQDLAETVLFRIIRGTGTDGLCGIERKRKSEKGYFIIRPILGIDRPDIESFCREYDLKPHTDHTNLEPLYSRNKIRLGLIPYISENFNENIIEALNRLASIAGEDKEYIWHKTEEAYAAAKKESSVKGEEILMLRALADAPDAIRHRMIRRAFENIGLVQDIGAVHIEAADSIIRKGQTGKTAEFPYGYYMTVRYDEAAFISPARSEQKKLPGLKIINMKREEWEDYKKASADGSRISAALDLDNFKEKHNNITPVIRYKEKGDYIAIKGGRKKIQDLLVDSKVPRDLRNSVPVIASGSEILFIPGRDMGIKDSPLERSRYSASYAVSAHSAEIMILEIEI